MTLPVWTHIEEDVDPEHRLGRHIHRPEGFHARTLSAVAPNQSISWKRYVGPFNQGNLGSCTGNAAAGVLMSDPFYATIPKPPSPFGEPEAVTIYSAATHFNGDPNSIYPPNDGGSSGPASAQACEQLGFISGYNHTVDLPTTLTAFLKGPGSFGVNWMTSFDNPLSTGECPLTPGATVRGGHEIHGFSNDAENSRVWFYQSWGDTWGGLGNGTFWFSYATLTSLFNAGADTTFFIPKA
jgi:hypothetical protein